MSEGGDTLLLAPISPSGGSSMPENTEDAVGNLGGYSSPETILSSPAEERHQEASSSGPAKAD